MARKIFLWEGGREAWEEIKDSFFVFLAFFFQELIHGYKGQLANKFNSLIIRLKKKLEKKKKLQAIQSVWRLGRHSHHVSMKFYKKNPTP